MNIYHSSQYIGNPKVGDLQLKVNCQWDFGARSVCTKRISNLVIGYDLEECAKVDDRVTTWKKAEITDDIKEELTKMGYNTK